MNGLVTGEIAGLAWYELPNSVMKSHQGLMQSVGTMTVVCPKGHMPNATRAAYLLQNSTNLQYLFTYRIGVQLFDEAEMEGRTIRYEGFIGFDLMAWARERVEIPENIDLSFDLNTAAGKLHAVARTMRNGRMVNVRRLVPDHLLFTDAIKPILGYLSRNCPRVEGEEGHSCGEHVAAALKHLNEHGLLLLRHWMQQHEQHPNRIMQRLSIPGHMLPSSGIRLMQLDVMPGSNAIKAEISLIGGHEITEDGTGVEVKLKTTLPETIRVALKGRTMEDVIGMPWAAPLVVKIVRNPKDGMESIRTTAPGTALILPDVAQEVGAIDAIDALGHGDGPAWKTVHASATPVLDKLTESEIVSVLALGRIQSTIDLAPFGHEGWELRARGDEIVVEKCPTIDLEEYLHRRFK